MLSNKTAIVIVLFLLSLSGMSYAQTNDNLKTTTFNVNLHCENCKEKVVKNMAVEKGIEKIEVNLADKYVRISYNPSLNSDVKLISCLEHLGYSASVRNDETTIENECGCDEKCFSKRTKTLSLR